MTPLSAERKEKNQSTRILNPVEIHFKNRGKIKLIVRQKMLRSSSRWKDVCILFTTWKMLGIQ